MSAIDRMIGYLLAMSKQDQEKEEIQQNTNYSRRLEWEALHNEIMGKLGLNCELKWSRHTKVGAHVFHDDAQQSCSITVNPNGDFRVPQHLLLHEAAHHRNMIKKFGPELDFDLSPIEMQCCLGGWSRGHCPHWAAELVECYRICGVDFPESTQFHEFAKAAKIEWRPFYPDKDGTVGKE